MLEYAKKIEKYVNKRNTNLLYGGKIVKMQKYIWDKAYRGSDVTEYASSLEHLGDELKRFDMMLYLHVLSHDSYQVDNPLDQLKGLVVSREEITRLLKEKHNNLSEQMVVKELSQELENLSETIKSRRSESLKKGIFLTINALSEIFGLNPIEEQCIIICLAIELDSKYEKIYGYIQDDITKKKPTVDMALKLLGRSFEDRLDLRSAFKYESPLIKFLTCADESVYDEMPLISHELKLHKRVVDFILEHNYMDHKLVGFTHYFGFPEGTEELNSQNRRNSLVKNKLDIIEKVEQYFAYLRQEGRNTVLNFYGPPGSGKKLLTENICKTLKLPLVAADLSKLDRGKLTLEQALLRLVREAMLQRALLCIENPEGAFNGENESGTKIKSLIETVHGYLPVTFILSSEKLDFESFMAEVDYLAVEVEKPDEPVRRELWDSFIKELDVKCRGIDGIAEKFTLTPGQMRNALKHASRRAVFESGRKKISKEELYRSCRIQSSSGLGKLSEKIEPKQGLEDIVLPDDQMDQLEEIIEYVRHKEKVYGKWGFGNKLSRGKGTGILFSGPPGTGKTMAAEVISKELMMDLYRIDLSQVVSKYIGETEKNLSRIFKEAETSNAILFFDEADALFGKRSEVKDAHDRYANVETAYLLQKMEEYEGITILATNLRGNMDEAFTRRLVFTLDFPFPEEEYRKRLWESVFPKEAPIGSDVDFGFLSSRFRIPGGNIRNIALKAAFYAAKDNSDIRMIHIIKAVKREYQKMGRICVKSDFGDYYDMVK